MKQKQKIIVGLLSLSSLFSFVAANVFVSEDTSHWLAYSDTCSSVEANHIAVTPTTIPTYWTGNTIYDLEAGTYNLTAGINITESCTAIVGADDVIINGNGTTVITVTNNFNIIKNLSINGNSADGIVFSSSNSNAVIDTTIYSANRGIYITNTTNTHIRNTKTFGNTIGIYLETNTNDNIFNNFISFNNNQFGFYINGGNKNSINNSLIFNNASFGFLIQAGTQNILNNSIVYNNGNNGLRMVAGNYLNKTNTFNNLGNTFLASSIGFGVTNADVALPLGLALGSSTDPILGTVGWTSGSINSSLIVDSSQILNPFDGTNYLVDTSTGASTRKGVKTFGITLDIANSTFGANLPNQVQPVQWNVGGTALENSSISFSASSKIGQTLSYGGGGSASSSEGVTICGNGVLESMEQCDDGNKWNGDGCTSVCQIEEPGICGNGILEYMEQCDDGNLNNGDGCSIACRIESSSEMYNKNPLIKKEEFGSLASVNQLLSSKNVIMSGDKIISGVNPSEIILLGLEQNEQLTPSLECQYNDIEYHNINFNDISGIYGKEIQTLTNYCIIQGRSNKSFASKQAATFAEFIKVLVKAHFLGRQINFQSPSLPIQNIYPLVNNKTWYAPYITKAYVYDLLMPLDTTIDTYNLAPESFISRLDAITLLINALKIEGKNPKNIESVTDTFGKENSYLTREEMAALITHGYELNYEDSQKIRSNNKLIIKLISKSLTKYELDEQLNILKKAVKAIGNLKESYLERYDIYKKELLIDLQNILDLYNN